MVLLVTLQASAEEVLFRGFAVQTVLGRIGWSSAKFWVLSAILATGFAAAHATADLATGIAYLLFALVFSWLAWRFAGIEAAIGVHVANNLVALAAGLLRGDDVMAGQADVTASVLDIGIQLGAAVLVSLVVVLVARRELARG